VSTPPRFCAICHTARVAWSHPRVDCCYGCLPGGPFTPPRCRRCNSPGYFSQGLCEICHPGSPRHPGPCRDCLAWGVLREHNWLCWSCRGWRSRHPVGLCPYCGQQRPLGQEGACRLCWKQAEHTRIPGEPLDLAEANRLGQQLFLANMHYQPRRPRRPDSPPRRHARTTGVDQPVVFAAAQARQLALFPSPRPSLASTLSLPEPPDPVMAAHCDRILREHAANHGWTRRLTNVVGASLRALQAWQDTPGSPIKASEAQRLLGQPGRTTVESTLEVLAAAGLLDDDRVPAVRTFFLAKTAGLPATMRAQLEIWYGVLAEGSSRPPRRRPRHPRTIQVQIAALHPVLSEWAEHGCASLTEITRAQVVAALPADPVARPLTVSALRSLFGLLKARKEIFTNPARGVQPGPKPTNIPLPRDTAVIRAALNSPDPARALAVALVAFHGLVASEIRHIKLTDLRDGSLIVGDRVIPLAGPVQVRLSAYLDHRARRFPETANPYLLVNRRSAPRTTPVANRWPWQRHHVQARQLREDRILHEIFATGGDVRRICDLFGLSVNAAMRYTLALEHPDLATDTSPGS
jgi:integrase